MSALSNLNLRIVSSLVSLFGGFFAGLVYVFMAGVGSYKWLVALCFGAIGVAGMCLFIMLKIRLRPIYLLIAIFLTPISFDINFMYQDDPLFYNHANGYGITTPDVLFGMLVFLLLADYVMFRRFGATLPLPKYWIIPLGGLFLINTLSAIQTPHPFYAYSMLWANFKMLVIFWFIAKSSFREDTLWRLGYVAAGIVGMQGIIVLEQKFVGLIFTAENLGQNIDWASNVGTELVVRNSGTLGQPNALAMFINLFMLVAIFTGVIEKRTLPKVLVFSGVFLGIVAEIFTASRGGWMSLGFAFIITFILWMVFKKGRGVLSSIALVGLLGSTLFGMLFTISDAFRNRLTQDDQGTAEVRIPLMEVAQNLIAANPFTGVGLNHYTYFMQAYDRTFDAISFNYAAPVHNTYMLVAGEIGIPGMMLFVVFLFTILAVGISVFLRSKSEIGSMIGLGTFGGILTFMIHNTVDPTSIYAEYPIWILSGVAASILGDLNRDEPHPHTNPI